MESLLGDPSNAREKLGWVPQITFAEMVQEMMQHDLDLAKRDELVESEGYRSFQYFE